MDTATPAAAPGFSMASAGIGLWVHRTELALGHLHEIRDAGFDYLIVKIADDDHGFDLRPLPQLLHDAASIGMPVVVWAYVYPGDPEGDAAAILKNIPAGVKDVILDAEVEWEEAPAKYGAATAVCRVHMLCKPLTAKGLRLHLSSFWSPKLHAGLPWRAFLLHSQTLQPQCYVEAGSRTADAILSTSIMEFRGYITKQTYVPTVNATAFLPLLKAKGIKNFSVYLWDAGAGDAEVASHLPAWKAAIAGFKGAG